MHHAATGGLRQTLALAIQRSSNAPTLPAAGTNPSIGRVYMTDAHCGLAPPQMPPYGAPMGPMGGGFGMFVGQATPGQMVAPMPGPPQGTPGGPPPPATFGAAGQGMPAENEKDHEIDRLRRELRKCEEKNNFFRSQVLQLQQRVFSMDVSAATGAPTSSASSSQPAHQLRAELTEERARSQQLEAQLQVGVSRADSVQNPAEIAVLQARIGELERELASVRAATAASATAPLPRGGASPRAVAPRSEGSPSPHSVSGGGSSAAPPPSGGAAQQAPALRGDPLDPAENAGAPKRAVIVGCDYPGQLGSLRAGVADAQQWARFLTKRCGVAERDIRLLSDDPAHYQIKDRPDLAVASRDNVLRALQWLVARSATGDQLFFVFCGHGVQVVAEEFAGQKLCENAVAPTDVSADGEQPRVVSDTDVHKALKGVPSGAQATLIYDCCHAGQPLDRAGLNFLTEYVNRGKVDYEKLKGHPVLPRFLELRQWKARPNPPEAVRESSLRCQAVQWAPCANGQFCVELPIDERPRGVFTYIFITALLKLGVNATSEALYQEMLSLTSQLKGRWRLQQDVQMTLSASSASSQQFVR